MNCVSLAAALPVIFAATCFGGESLRDAQSKHSLAATSQNRVLNFSAENPVILVHGIKDDARKMERIARRLRSEGREVFSISLRPSWGQVGLDKLAQELAAYADQNISSAKKFDLVGFSMGGLVCRYYLQRLGGIDHVQRFVTLASPHRGTIMAYLISNPGCRQMRPNSAFLRDLNSDAQMLARIQFTSIWTPLDLIVIPQNSPRLGVGREIRLWMPVHPLMVLHPRAIRTVAEVLSA
jgi:triacylglycerol lipase